MRQFLGLPLIATEIKLKNKIKTVLSQLLPCDAYA